MVQNPQLLPLQGKTIAEIAKLWNKDPIDTIFDLLIEDNAFTEVAVFGMSEPDVALALQQPWVSVDNDSQGTAPDGLLGQEHPHPRAYGTFPRILRKYVREEKKLRLEDAIRKFSALPAQRMRLTDRGVLKAGMWADVVVFDPQTITDLATFENPNQLSEGMQYVLVNGVPVIDGGKATNALPGKVLRGAGLSAVNRKAMEQIQCGDQIVKFWIFAKRSGCLRSHHGRWPQMPGWRLGLSAITRDPRSFFVRLSRRSQLHKCKERFTVWAGTARSQRSRMFPRRGNSHYFAPVGIGCRQPRAQPRRAR